MGPNGKVLSKTYMDRRIALQLCQDILQIPDCEILISGENTSYLIPKTKQYEAHIRYFVGNQVAILSSPEQMPEDFLKISAWYQTGVDRIEHLLRPQWEKDLSTAIAGFAWLDFTVADKGTGIRALSGYLGIPVSEMLAMGDNYNDVPMLDAVGSPVIMQSAAQPLLDRYPTHAARPEDILASLLREFQTC